MGAHAGYRPNGNETTVVDFNYNYVTLLLKNNGTNAAQNNTFLDSSSNNFTITRNGNTTQGSFSPYGNNWSVYFSSVSTDYLTLPSNTATNLSNSDFTFEGWFNKIGNPAQAGNLIWWNGNSNNSSYCALRIQLNIDGTISLLCSENGSSWQISTSSTSVYSDFVWNHVAAVRNGQTVTVYLNGISICSGSLSSSSASLYAGTLNYINNMAYSSGTWKMIGYVSNVRLVKGTALYTANFTPSTTPLAAITNTSLLTCQSNRFIDNSSNNFTITRNGDVRVTKESPFFSNLPYTTTNFGGSGYFDGTGDYLTVPDNAAFDLAAGDWTVETWFNLSALPASSGASSFVSQWKSSATTSLGWFFYLYNNAGTYQLYLSYSTTGSNQTNLSVNLSAAPSLGTWNHVAFVRSGTNFLVFLNGAQVGSTQTLNATIFNSTTSVWIGAQEGVNYLFNGYLSDLRIVKGTALYTAAFTPPTAPVTAITNTSLLLNFTNAGIYDAAAKTVFETVGDVKINTSIQKYSTGSLYFDGTGDYLITPYSPQYNIGTGDFTLEAWVYPTSGSGIKGLLGNHGAFTGGGFGIYVDGLTPNGQVFVVGSTSSDFASGPAMTLSAWNHVAFVRRSGTITVYTNGIGGTPASSSRNPDTTYGFYIGAYEGTSYLWTGYLEDVRLTKGLARYTANFTPPTGPLATNKAGY